MGGEPAATLLLTSADLVGRVWTILSARESEQHLAALAALRAAAAHAAGVDAILLRVTMASKEGDGRLASLLRAADERARVAASGSHPSGPA